MMFAFIELTEDVNNDFIDYNKALRDILVDLAAVKPTNNLTRRHQTCLGLSWLGSRW